jgi:hypothetical protein
VNGEQRNRDRVRGIRLPVLVAAGALPLLVSCSSSSSVEYATDAFPSQSLVDLLKTSKDAPPPAPSVPPAAPAAADASPPAAASAQPPPRESPPVAATAAASPPPAVAPSSGNDDPVAAAFPSVSLVDLLKGERKPGSQ